MREQKLLSEVLTDNDSVFLNETIRDYCLDAGIEFTRCRPYRKNDQAFVEQKNGAVVRRIVGYRRLEGLEAAAALAQLYSTVRLFVNFFQPSFKLAEKERDGARVRKRYHLPATPCQQLMGNPQTPASVRAKLAQVAAQLDPVRLLSDMRTAQQRLVASADRLPTSDSAVSEPALDEFLSGLRTAWREGENTTYCKAKTKTEAGTAAS